MVEVIRLVEKLGAANQLTAILTPSTVSMMSGSDRCFVCRCTGYFGHQYPDASFMGVMNFATLHRIATTRFLPQEHHTSKTDLVHSINTPITKGTDHTLMVPDIGDISAGNSPAAIPTMTEAVVLEGMPIVNLPATAAAHATLWPMDIPITTCAMTPTDIVSPHLTLAISSTDITHANLQT